MNETKEQQRCAYCHSNSRLLMSFEDDDGNGDADVYVDGRNLIVDVTDKAGIYIKYCPMCGRRLVEAQHED